MTNFIIIYFYNSSIKISIINDIKFENWQIDLRIFLSKLINIWLNSEKWMSMRYNSFLDVSTHLLISFMRYCNAIKETYASCLYAIITCDITHLMIINSSLRSMYLSKNQIIDIFKSIISNIKCFYINSVINNII